MILTAPQKHFVEMRKVLPAFWEQVPVPVITMEKAL